MNPARILFLASGLLAVGLGTACLRLEPRPDTVRFYVLSSSPREEAANGLALENGRPVFVARVEAPNYLGNPGIAFRSTASRIEFSTMHQWAEPIRDGATRVLRDALGRELGPDRLHAATVRRPAGPHLELQVTLLQFECTTDATAILRSRWQLVQEPERQRLLVEETVCRRPYSPSEGDFTPEVSALSACLEDLAEIIARQVSTVESRLVR